LAGEHGLPVLYHGVVTPEDVRRFPETNFVAAHGLCQTAKYALAECPNFYVDTAYSQNTPRECAEAVRILGPDRIVWASDAPLADFAQRLGIILDADISEDDKRQILGRNALRLLNMSPACR
jgi:predicted TIM-barrel fold metal-dependent hydrolase